MAPSEKGNDSIQVMLTAFFSRGAIARASAPAWLGRRSIRVVLSLPVRCSDASAITAKRVTLCGWSSMLAARIVELMGGRRRPALATAAANSSRWACSAAAAVETTSTSRAWGRFFPSQWRHCDSACALE